MTTKHTTGPWRLHDAPRRELSAQNGIPLLAYLSQFGQEASFCKIVAPQLTPEQQIANALLIAAAPDLLAALREFLDADISGDREVRLHGARAQARAALAKAEAA